MFILSLLRRKMLYICICHDIFFICPLQSSISDISMCQFYVFSAISTSDIAILTMLSFIRIICTGAFLWKFFVHFFCLELFQAKFFSTRSLTGFNIQFDMLHLTFQFFFPALLHSFPSSRKKKKKKKEVGKEKMEKDLHVPW